MEPLVFFSFLSFFLSAALSSGVRAQPHVMRCCEAFATCLAHRPLQAQARARDQRARRGRIKARFMFDLCGRWAQRAQCENANRDWSARPHTSFPLILQHMQERTLRASRTPGCRLLEEATARARGRGSGHRSGRIRNESVGFGKRCRSRDWLCCRRWHFQRRWHHTCSIEWLRR